MLHNTTRIRADECKPPDHFNDTLRHDEDEEQDDRWIAEEAERQAGEKNGQQAEH